MSLLSIIFISVSLSVILSIYRKMSFLQIIQSVLSGIAAVLACDLLMSFLGNNMPVNIYTVSISAFGGIPFVILLILVKTFLL